MLKESIYEFSEFLDSVNDIFYQDPEYPLSEQEQENTLNLLEQVADMEKKQVDELCRQFRNAQLRLENYRGEAKLLTDKAKSLESHLLRMKVRLMEVIIAKTPSRKLKGEVYSMTVRQTPSLVIDNMEAIPKEFVKVKTEVSADKLGIKKAIKEGMEISGCHLENNLSLIVG